MARPAIICVGMTVVDVLVEGVERLPPSGQTGAVDGVTMTSGGDAINQAKVLAKLGNQVALWSVTGDDAQGAFIRQQCQALGIDTEGLAVDPALSTTTALVLIDRRGEHSFLVNQNGSHHRQGPQHIDLARVVPGLKILSVGSLMCSEALDRDALPPLLKAAKAAGAITLADMVMDRAGHGLEALAGVWPVLDYAAPSALEGELLTGHKEPRAIAAEFQKRGVKNVIVKQGEQGVTLFQGDQVFRCPAYKVKIADTTGAGDSFMGGFIHALARGFAPGEALRFASAVAALSIEEVGAGAGVKNLAQVEAFLAAHRE